MIKKNAIELHREMYKQRCEESTWFRKYVAEQEIKDTARNQSNDIPPTKVKDSQEERPLHKIDPRP